ncbi:hypothetical protein QFC21_001345 [Naganishia friedmannii]|uniref:Uncharacterized protein n=1 Tax=Naganishia friedmannii TaxID=89922 RepID=A0ACC2W560_9TREE|nr:hypothetical protein QFC21_001345 [Naganishia friedmannii]
MSRRDVRAIRRLSNGDDEKSSAFDPMEEGDEEEEEEEEEDPSSAARYPSTLDAGDSSHFVEVHWDIVYAKTYRIPQLLFTVSDSTGTPLSLSEVIAAGVIFHHSRAPPGTRIHKDHMDLLHPDGNGGAISDSSSSGYGMEGAEFPLLQRNYHPYPRNEPGSNVRSVPHSSQAYKIRN